MKKTKLKENGLTYENRLQNISYEEAKKHVLEKFGAIKTRESVGMMWTQRTKSIQFLDDEDKIVAIYNITIRDFWFTEQEAKKC